MPRDVFLYLLSIISLVASAVSSGILLFEYINVYFPDVISDPYFSPSHYYGQMRSALAALVVFFPVYIWVSRFLKGDIEENPEKRDLKIRKWLLYLTLFAASLTIIGDLIALIYNFLEGELTLRFILKIISIFVIASSVFYYYLHELKDKIKEEDGFMKIFIWGAIIFVAAVGVSGFIIAGSPQSQRLVRFDERRVNDLQMIQGQIINYWQNKQVLPENLDQLVDDIYSVAIPADPKTGQSYEYEVLNSLTFKLCAMFETSTKVQTSQSKGRMMPIAPAPYGDYYPFKDSTWDHEVGQVCFERTIDPQIIRPITK